jgi:hypothetical protein
MRWITDSEDNVADQCAHGDVVFAIDSIPFAAGREAKDLTVSAAALFLLRTLAHDHTPAVPVAEDSQLFPHCGHAVYTSEERFPVLVLGCNDGIDLRRRRFRGNGHDSRRGRDGGDGHRDRVARRGGRAC